MYAFLGVLGALATDLTVPVGRAGQLATAFAITFALTAPMLVPATRRLGAKNVLLASLLGFGLLNLLGGLAPRFSLLFSTRIVGAICASVFAPVAGAVATTMVAPEDRGKALAAVVSGMVIAFAAGIPLGTFLGGAFGWRATFVFAAVCNVIGAIAIGAGIPATGAPPPQKASFAFLRRWAVLSNLVMVMIAFAGVFMTISYVGPLLGALTGFRESGIGALQISVGFGGALGTVAGGLLADRRPTASTLAAAFALCALSFLPFSVIPTVTTAGSTLSILGCAGALFFGSTAAFSLVPILQFRVVREAQHEAPTALAFYFAFFYFGQGVGAAIGGIVVEASGLEGLGTASAICMAIGALGAATLAPDRAPSPADVNVSPGAAHR